jgi:hypothetical protein
MPDSLQVDWKTTVDPTVEPVSLSDLRSTSTGSYLRVDFSDDDTVLTALISQCRAIAERITSKALAPQTIQALFTMPTISADFMSGPSLAYDSNFYQFNESLGSNPWGPAPYVLKLPMPPLTAVSLFQYRQTAFDAWSTWPATSGSTTNYAVETLTTPGQVYLQYPPSAYQYRLTYTCGYTTLPSDLKLALMQLIAWKYENRLGENPPDEIVNALVGKKTWIL